MEHAARRATWEARVRDELRDWLLVSGYLALFFCAVTAYRGLADAGASAFRFGYSVVEALVVGKFILIGRAFGVGEGRHRRAQRPGRAAPAEAGAPALASDGPLIFGVLNKTACYGLLILALSVVEHLLEGALHGMAPSAVMRQTASQGIDELLARVLVLILALVPLFALSEVGRALGGESLFRLLFVGTGARRP